MINSNDLLEHFHAAEEIEDKKQKALKREQIINKVESVVLVLGFLFAIFIIYKL